MEHTTTEKKSSSESIAVANQVDSGKGTRLPSVPFLQKQTASNTPSPLQRKIRVDGLEDGAFFEDIEFVPKHFGLSPAGQTIYLRWLKDKADHHYINKKQLVEALEANSTPSTTTFKNIFVHAAEEANVNIHWLEQYLTDKGSTLLTLNQETPEDIVEKIKVRKEGSDISVEKIQEFTLKELMDEILESNILTQSCGNTANLIHEFLSPSTSGSKPAEMNLAEVISAINIANEKSGQQLVHQYVKIEGGGHAFVIEVFNNSCKIFQSFFGRYSFAKDLEREKAYPIGQFIPKFQNAMATKDVPEKTSSARLELFNSQAVHPDGKFRINVFAQENSKKETVGSRIAGKLNSKKEDWDQSLGGKALPHLKNEEDEEEVHDGPPITVLNESLSTINATLHFGDPQEEEEESEEITVENLEPDVTTGYYGKFKFVYKSTDGEKYKFVYSKD